MGHGAAPPTDPVARALARAHGVLPDQGPIGVFIHHNTLHAFQARPFHEAVQAGAELLGARPYLSLDEFRAHVRRGRIEEQDLDAELDRELAGAGGAEVAPGLTRRALWRALLVPQGDEPLESEDVEGLRHLLGGEASRGRAARVEAFRAALVAAGPRPGRPPRLRRHGDVLALHAAPPSAALVERDTDEVVQGELIRLAGAFLDQGQAASSFPGREHGFLGAVARAVRAGGTLPRACRGAEADLAAALERGATPEVVVREALAALGVEGDDVEPFVLATLLALPGWGGMFSRLERFPQERPHGPPVALLELLAVRLVLERRALERACAARGLPVAWRELKARAPAPPPRDPLLDAFLLARVVPALPTEGPEARADLLRVLAEVEAFGPLRRRALLQEAYERRYRRQILDGLAARRRAGLRPVQGRPAAQFVFCIDEREESIHRALDEQGPHLETLSAAGFFGVAIDYRGLDDHEAAAYCPVVVTPAHEVQERPEEASRHVHAARARLRTAWHRLELSLARASRTLLGGAGVSVLFGPIAGALATTRISAPRGSLLLRDAAAGRLARSPSTRLSSHRAGDARGETGKPLGFSTEEAAQRVCSTLENMGLVRPERLAPVVILLGHGSTSLNNPHESAHDCGACGGRRGGANARLFAALANRPDVRAAARARGVVIPDDTWFVGALHDTANDAVTYGDLDLIPAERRADFERAHAALEAARRESARERCRRFEAAPLDVTPDDALLHVEGRASSLGQPRPEYGHCTNAVAVVGRRALTRGLHLDRRAFLITYDPAADEPSTPHLERILAAVGPVGAGISLEYYFSSVDNEVYGCGTKLPHNVTGLLGVMNGHQGDLRTGLPLQMVELHEPMRLLLIVEATPEQLLAIAGRQAEVRELVVNRWVQLVSVHPETGAMAFFERPGPLPGGQTSGQFVPYEPSSAPLPVVERSAEWHMRTREHLPPALVTAGLPPAPPARAPAAPLVAVGGA